MDVSYFIAGRLRFKGKIVMVCIAVSFLVMIIAVAVSSGFRAEIRSGLSSLSGDIQLSPSTLNVMDENTPVEISSAYRPYIEKVEGVKEIIPVIYRAGIVKAGDNIHGVLFKGLPEGASYPSGNTVPDSVSLAVSVPSRLAEITGLAPGDRMLTYFVGENMKVRQFNVVSVHDALLQVDDRLVVYVDLKDMQRLNGWSENEASCIEIHMDENHDDEVSINAANDHVGTLINVYSSEDEEYVIATSSVSRYPQLFDWLDLIDFNVMFILILMTIVAGFNMISGLLIMLFENISTIGLLKALGMTDKAISKVFLSSSAVLVLKGMAAGNIMAFLLCLIQDATHVLRLDPENYFVSYVPVKLDFGLILSADIAAFAVILILLLIPCMFIAKVDPADTVRVK